MRVKQMYHLLCCLPLENGNQSPEIPTSGGIAGSESSTCFAGVLYKWTNYSKGWRSRWFVLRHGVLSYSKIHRLENFANLPGNDVSLIGDVSSARLVSSGSSRRKNTENGIIHLKISSFRESRSDNRRFYVFTATKTLHLRTHSKKERLAWINALVSTRCLYSLNDNLSLVPSNLSLSTEKLKKCLLENGISEILVKDCEQIMISEFSDIEGQVKVLCEERSNLLDTLRQLEAANFEAETSGAPDGEYNSTKFEYSSSSLGRGKYTGYSTTESSDDAGKQELEEVSDEEEPRYFDTEEYFPEATTSSGSIGADYMANRIDSDSQNNDIGSVSSKMDINASGYPPCERRNKLPDPVEKEKGVSLWAMIKDMVGKDLSRVCLPVYFNEPISTLQKCFEELEYSHLLDRAYEYGKEGNSLLRILNVAAFAVSGYASTDGRHCKPFNPMLGETYEADYPEKGVRFFSEKVSHHPTLIACHCEGKGWKFWGDSNLRSKFWGRSIQLDPLGTLTLEFDDGEIFQWSKVTTTIYNLILGKLYCDHHGTMQISGNRQYSCTLKFKEQSILDRNPRQVHGFVEDDTGEKVATLCGKWDEHMYYTLGDRVSKPKDFSSSSLLWKRKETPPNLTRYNLTPFAITLNELTPGLQLYLISNILSRIKEKLPPTDSRLRPDQRHLENGEYDKANEEKQRLETRQRMSRKLQENGWRARWFNREGEDGHFHYAGGYWEARENRKWDGCADIFGQFCEDLSSPNGS